MAMLNGGNAQAAYDTLLAASLEPGIKPEIVAGIALCLGKLGRLDECIGQWEHLAKVAPKTYAGAHQLHHVGALLDAGRLDEARDLLRSCQDGGPDNGLRVALARRLSALRKATASNTGQAQGSAGREVQTTTFKAEAGALTTQNDGIRDAYKGLISHAAGRANALKYKNLVIVTYGRTGSTLLLGILNSIPGLRVLGENAGAFRHLFEYLNAIKTVGKHKNTDLPTSPFFGAGQLDQEAIKTTVRQAIDTYFAAARQEPGVTCVGFKDVRYFEYHSDLVAYLEFLEEMLDDPAFVFLWRDHADVMQSGWWKSEDRIAAADTLKKVERQAAAFAAGRSNCIEIDYTDLVSATPKLEALHDFLGADFETDRVSRILSFPHSYDPTRRKVQDLFADAKPPGAPQR